MNQDNESVRLADAIDWECLEERYEDLFPSEKRNPAKPLRMVLGALLMQKNKGLSDRKNVKEKEENLYA